MASEMMILPEVAELLEAEARRINAPEFVAADPVQFQIGRASCRERV